MSHFKCPAVMKQIEEFGTRLEQLKIDIQLCNQSFKNTPGTGLNPKGPMGQILTTLEDCQFFFEQLLKAQGLKYLPKPDDSD